MWLHLPTSACSPGAADLTSLSESQSRALAALVTVSGKVRRPPYWLRAWPKARWMKRLSGLTCEPSQANFIVAAWLESLADSHAQTSALPDGKPESPESTADSGSSTLDSFARFNHDGSLSRTSHQCSLFPQEELYSENLPKQGSMRNGYLYERPTLALRTEGSGCSFSRGEWPTPVANDDNKTPEAHLAMKARMKGGPLSSITSLNVLTQLWLTPRSEDSESAGNHPGAVDSLTGATRLWATPRTITGGGETAERKKELGRDGSGGGDLQAQVSMWNTPAARDYRSPNADPDQHPDQLANQVCHSSLPDPATTLHGAASSPSGQTSRRRLVDALTQILSNYLWDCR